MIIIETVPTDASKLNPSGAVTRDDDGNPTVIQMVTRGKTFQMTLTWTDGYMTAWTVWSEV